MKAKIAINGFGRIGRIFLREVLKKPELEVVAINDLTDVNTLAHLFKYDSVHGKYTGNVEVKENELIIDGNIIKVFAERDPENLPWAKLSIDVVLESTGLFRDEKSAGKHLKAGAKRVMISAPPKGGEIKTYVMGVNESEISEDELIISNASCTTNCCAHVVKHVMDGWGIEAGYLTTIHAYTNDQNIHDGPHKDLRRARAAANSIIPTSTGAANALIKLFPSLDGKLKGIAARVPVINGSLTDMTFHLKKATTPELFNASMKQFCGELKGILEFCKDPIVSADIVGNSHSGIYDSLLTETTNGGMMLKVVVWYDNEYGYSARCADLMSYMYKKFN